MYFKEISWRVSYLIFSYLFCRLICIYYGEFLLAFCREPWYNEWEMDSMQYVNPREIWGTYTKISFLFSLILVYPLICIHILIYFRNRLTKQEVFKLISYRLFSNLSIYMTWFILVDYSRIGALMDLSHFDEDTDIIYVPNLITYIDSWFSLMVSGWIAGQLPLAWIYRNSLRNSLGADSNGESVNSIISSTESTIKFNSLELEDRLWFIIIFVIPSLTSSLFLFDDIRLAIIWIRLLRSIYILLLFLNNIYQNY